MPSAEATAASGCVPPFQGCLCLSEEDTNCVRRTNNNSNSNNNNAIRQKCKTSYSSILFIPSASNAEATELPFGLAKDDVCDLELDLAPKGRTKDSLDFNINVNVNVNSKISTQRLVE
eukprot:jgi/Psemu1/4343/gm1.4343_g